MRTFLRIKVFVSCAVSLAVIVNVYVPFFLCFKEILEPSFAREYFLVCGFAVADTMVFPLLFVNCAVTDCKL